MTENDAYTSTVIWFEESQTHFIFHCKLFKITLDFIRELINLDYSFNIAIKISPKTTRNFF